jgi:pimeloyl-ACP methyl ester carboxylesterase
MPAWLVAARGGGTPRGVVVLLAENGGNRAAPRMLWLAGVVSRTGFDALLVDLRGHGGSGGVNTYGLGETLDLLAILDALRRDEPGRPVAAVGFSLGASCILRAMTLTDTIRAAAVFAPYARLDRDFVAHELAFQSSSWRLRWVATLFSPRLIVASIRFWAGFARLPEPAELVTNLPVLLYHCTGDPEVPYTQALAIRAGARAPLLELHPVPRNVHLPPLEDSEVWAGFGAALERLLDHVAIDPSPSRPAQPLR